MALVVTALAAKAPPSAGDSSTTATLLPKYAAWAAAFSPAGPAPTTTMSKRSATRSGSDDLPMRDMASF